MTVAVVIGKFLPPHRGHSYLIERAGAEADRVVVIVCARTDDLVPADVRAAMLAELHPGARVTVTPDDIPDDRGEATSKAWAERTLDLLGAAPDVVCSSEEYGPRYARFLGARHVSVDPGRQRYPISGTAVRADPWGTADFLAPTVKAWFVRRVCVVGAESTGTTTLARDLPGTTVARGCPSTAASTASSDRRRSDGTRRTSCTSPRGSRRTRTGPRAPAAGS